MKVDDADSVASVFSRSRIVEILLKPPSIICSWLVASLAFSYALGSVLSHPIRSWLVMASSVNWLPLELMR